MEYSAEIAELDPLLSRRLHQALTAGKDEIFQTVTDPSMEVLHAALKNPLIDDNHLLVLLKRRDLSGELLSSIYKLSLAAESHELKIAMAHNPATPAHVTLALLPHLYLFELVDICYLPDATPDLKVAAERAIIQRLSVTPLGNKITLVRRGTSALVEALIKEGDQRMMEACLANPHLKEAAIFQFLNGPNATPDGISAVARHPRWKGRINLQLAILKNPKTPSVWYTLFLPHLGVGDLKGVIASKRITQAQKKIVQEELRRRGL
ncbi:MAG TPA: hypothetical protein VMJ66_16715 [Geobacteraceae bacterium]|nr:hypothetical protein [Geobacteraceae bacterium]